MNLKVFDFIVEYKQTHNGNSPSNREIYLGSGLSSTSSVDYCLQRLEKGGLIRLPDKKIARSIEVIGGKWVKEMSIVQGNGRKADVLIDDIYLLDMPTGEYRLTDVIQIHADTGMEKVIAKVEGILWMSPVMIPGKYEAVLDRRYDREFVKKEIEAAILCLNPSRSI